ncbi:MAG: HPr family phosphocarrier protein [Chloroflexota bacterium]|nr:HPr family phosphocarrier protein [Chloroflexota bacterium]
MKELKVTITHQVGLHARPAALFVKTASKYSSNVTLSYNGKTKNARSMLGVLSMGVGANAEITIQAKGEDEEEVIIALDELIKDNFGE